MTDFYSVIGLGFGDESKGTTVNYIAQKYKKVLVIRPNGGCQSAHHVVLEDGEFKRFSQIGSSSISVKTDTYIGPNFIMNYDDLYKEKEVISGIIFVNPKTLLTNDISQYLNIYNFKANFCKPNTCAQGIGATREYFLKYGSDSLMVEDIFNYDNFNFKLELQRQRVSQQTGQHKSVKNINIQTHKSSNEIKVGMKPNVNFYDAVIFEHSQGVLLDEDYGIGPIECRTWSDMSYRHSKQICDELGIKWASVKKIGCLRSYSTRHGWGEFEDADELQYLSEDEHHNQTSDVQGQFRFGYHKKEWLDRALWILDGEVDELHISHCDLIECPQIIKNMGIPITVKGYGPKSSYRKQL